jgi:hypothetical protein
MEWAKILVPTLLAPLIGAVVVVYGWRKSHQLAAERDQRNKRRELRLSAMLDAYRALASSVHRPDSDFGNAIVEVEKALQSIQLLGTPAQIALVQRLLQEFGRNGTTDFEPVLLELRTSLREDLALEPVTGRLLFLRFDKHSEGRTHGTSVARPDGGAGG